jgi:hypothetical protein
MDQAYTKLWERINEMSVAIAELKTQVKEHATHGWVRDIIRPIEQSVSRMEVAVTSLSDDAKSLFAAHDAMLKEKAAAERAELESKTPMGLVKKYAPVIAFLLGAIALYGILSAAVQSWLRAHGF